MSPFAYGFNPRTRVGCELAKFDNRTGSDRFNPRTRVGCERLLNVPKEYGIVSIHAPVWGANIVATANLSGECFNPRTRVGCEPVEVSR